MQTDERAEVRLVTIGSRTMGRSVWFGELSWLRSRPPQGCQVSNAITIRVPFPGSLSTLSFAPISVACSWMPRRP